MYAINLGSGNVVPPGRCIGFYVTGAGNVVFVSNDQVITRTCAALSFHSCSVSQFTASGTTATGIEAHYI